MKKLFFLLSLLPFLTQSQSWTTSSNFIGDGRHHPITFSNDNFGFVVSGSYLNDVFKYDKLNDTWTQLQDFPGQGRGYGYAVSIGNDAYVGFGSTDNGQFPTNWWKYDMLTDTWFQLSSFIGDGRNHPAMVVVNNKIYVGCGSNDNGNLGDWWEYDITADSWSQKSDIIGYNRHHPFYFGIGDYAYVGFGHGSTLALEVTQIQTTIYIMTFIATTLKIILGPNSQIFLQRLELLAHNFLMKEKAIF